MQSNYLLQVAENEWVLVDTEAGVEYFGRGVVEGVDLVVMVVDPSHEAVLQADRARVLTAEAGKDFVTVLNKVDPVTEPFLRRELDAKRIPVRGAFGFSPEIMEANLTGNPLPGGKCQEQVNELLASLSF